MPHSTDEELEALLSDIESFRVERKVSWSGDAPSKGREAVCAFANDLSDSGLPGVLFVGARDDGMPNEMRIDDGLLTTLASMKSDGNIVPPPTLLVEKRSLYGTDVAVVTVFPSDSPPVRYKGRIWVRVGPRRETASAQDERILNEKRRYGDRPFDVRPMRDAVLGDLDVRRFEEQYLPNAFASDVLAANERSMEQRLAATKMILGVDDPTPTGLGVLTLSPRVQDFIPGAYAQFVRIRGTELADPISDSMEAGGPVADVIRALEQKLKQYNTASVDFTSGDLEQREAPYALAALQQLFRNAVMHRTYEGTNAPVRVYWFDDRVEIDNPRGPYGSVTVETFGEPGYVDYRNPSLAEALNVQGFVQRFGAGIATARRLLAENGNPLPEFNVTNRRVAVIVRASI